MRIYVASSWRNQRQPEVVRYLRAVGHETYDFREPRPGESGFSWSEIDEQWKEWALANFIDALQHPLAVTGFSRDEMALGRADACVLVLPCGRSAHLEAGFAVGESKALFILMPPRESIEPELMYRWARWIGSDIADLIAALREFQTEVVRPGPVAAEAR